jgi:hypothetical protein
MNHPGHDPFGYLGYAQHGPPVVVYLDDISISDPPNLRI